MDVLMCVCIIFVLLVLHAVWPKYAYDPQYDRLKICDWNTANTGDIILVKNCTKCKYTGNVMNDGFQFVYRNTFNTFRGYAINEHYTHVAIVIRLGGTPYICHVDGRSMRDKLDGKNKKEGVVVSGFDQLEVSGGMAHLYKYNGRPPDIDMSWIEKHRSLKYPKNLFTLTWINAMQMDVNPHGTMACTDFVQSTLAHMGIFNGEVSGNATIGDIVGFVKKSEYYERPTILNNRCSRNRHFA